MRVFHLPPRYMDNATLYSEYDTLMRLFKSLTKADPIQEDRLYWKYANHEKYVFYRLLMVSTEMENRDLDTDIDLIKLMDIASADSSNLEFNIVDIERDVQYLSELWDEDGEFDPAIPSFLEKLALTSAEQLLLEIQFMVSQYEDEYGV